MGKRSRSGIATSVRSLSLALLLHNKILGSKCSTHTHTHTKRWTVAHSEGRDVGVVVVADDKMTKKYGPRIASPTVKAKLLAWAKVAAKSIAAALI